ncbi:MAG: hypothetical protein AB1560_06500 [Pseudomonadota bacterium]
MIIYGLQFLVGLYFLVEAIIARTITSIVVFAAVWLSFDIIRILFVPLAKVPPKEKSKDPLLSGNEKKWGQK